MQMSGLSVKTDMFVPRGKEEELTDQDVLGMCTGMNPHEADLLRAATMAAECSALGGEVPDEEGEPPEAEEASTGAPYLPATATELQMLAEEAAYFGLGELAQQWASADVSAERSVQDAPAADRPNARAVYFAALINPPGRAGHPHRLPSSVHPCLA